MTAMNTPPLATLPQLIKATAIALAAAGVILVTAVLPAEYGIDPTGIGKAMGLAALSAPSSGATSQPMPSASAVTLSASTATVSPVMPTLASAVSKSEVPLRSDEMSLTLQPNEGAEIKASMRKGEQFVFAWVVDGGKVNVDMHGEKPNAGDEFTSYWEAMEQTSAQGSFVAPFDGSQGWYWRNLGDKPVTVKVKVSGFYEKLYKPKPS